MLAPLAASSLRYGACLVPITLERCLFSKITTTIWSGRGTAAFSFLGAAGRTVRCGFSGVGSTSARGLGSTPASRVGSSPAPWLGSTLALYFVGSVGTPVRKLPGGAVDPVDGGSATAQAADANSNIPAAAQPDRGKAR